MNLKNNMNKKMIFFKGKFVSEEEALIPITTHALHYGTGCFEGIRAYYSEKKGKLLVFRMLEHYERLLESSKILMVTPPYSAKELCEITVELIRKNFTKEDLYIRPLAYKSDYAVGNFNLKTLKNGFAIYTTPLGRYLNAEKGIRANISSWKRTPDNCIPSRAKITGAYVNTSLAKTESLLAGYDEAIFLNDQGHVSEGSAENIFIVKNGIAITPNVTDDILVGITRSTVILLCQNELKIKVEERSIDRSELYLADEVFLVGTGAEITSVIEIEGRLIGEGNIGKITKEIKDMYFNLVHGENSKYKNFITEISPN